MQKIFLIAIIIFLFACKQTTEQKVNKILSKHVTPTEKKDNVMQVGETIVFQHGETSGIDRGSFPATRYEKDIDTAFFTFDHSEFIKDGADGGTTYYFDIYKAIKKGNIKIESYKITQSYLSNPDSISSKTEPYTKEKMATYNFIIGN
jgi:hypothetical protein